MCRYRCPLGVLGKPFITLVAALLVVALLVGCAGAQPTPTPTKAAPAKATAPAQSSKDGGEAKAKSEAKPPAASNEPYRVGYVRPSSGPLASVLGNVQKGVYLVTEQVNKAGGINGHQIELVEYDNEGSAEKTITVVKRVVEQDKVIALLGPNMNANVKAAKPLLKNGPFGVFLTSSGKPDPDSYSFQALVTTTALQQKLFQFLKKNGYKKVVLLATTDSTGEDAVRDVGAAAKEAGGVDVVIERYGRDDVDVTPQMTKIRADKSIQAIIVWATGQQAAIPIKNAAQLGIDLPIYASPANLSNNFLSLIKGNEPKVLWLGSAKGIAWYDLPDSDPVKKIAASYAQPFEARYGEPADLMAFNGFDGAKLVYDALRAVGPDSKKMKEWVETLPVWEGAGMPHKFTKDNHEGDSAQDVVITQLKEGKWRIIE
ncbi:MAG: ABC transporter substrate-binding protein [Chloroflexi bacterium]|nr:ABC transporter substrate-binding protein [Chloroflexota bacterium]